MRSKLYVFPDDPPAKPVKKSSKKSAKKPVVHLISYQYVGAQRERMREQLLKGGLRLANVLNTIFQ
jgi:hypothetical protein